MPSTSQVQQKILVAQFVSLTGGTERQASRHHLVVTAELMPYATTQYLKSFGFKINDAVEAYYAAGHGTKATSLIESKLDSLFDSLRNEENDDKDKLELDSTMAYLADQVAINLENAELFVILELLQAPSVGEITRKGFVHGWKTAGAGLTHREHGAYAANLISSLATDVTLYKRIYRYAFIAGRERDQKALSLENALVYWGMLFNRPGIIWKTKGHNWLALWTSFLDDKWTRSVNKDMWNMTLEFALKTLADESLSFWTEDSAWPSVIDDFVSWCRVKGIGKVESMDVNADARAQTLKS